MTPTSTPIRLLSFNIQVGIETQRYRHYLTHGWKHLLPHRARTQVLTKIARAITPFDLVALQECDAGSLRSGYINQVDYLADQAGFPYCVSQPTRDWFPLAHHCNGLLSRRPPVSHDTHDLPGRVSGRGAISARINYAGVDLFVVLLHLSLGKRSRNLQLEYVSELVGRHEHVVLLGDMNASINEIVECGPLAKCGLTAAPMPPNTYPAWRPKRAIDHIVLSNSLKMDACWPIEGLLSDHRPIAASVSLR